MRGTLAAIATFGVLAGCGLATSGLLGDAPAAGIGDAGALDGQPAPVSVDATTPDAAPLQSDGTAPAADAGGVSSDATFVPDVASVDAADACAPSTAATALALIPAWPGPPPPKIDGDLSDWPCDGRVAFSGANAAYVKNGAHPLAAEVEVRWDMQNLYVAMHVIDATVTGDDPVNPYNNASVEVYVSGDATLNGDYDTTTHQYVTDYKANSVDYGPSHGGGLPDTGHAHYNASTKIVSDGWNFEAAIGTQALFSKGGSKLASATSLALDFEVNDGDGASQVAAIVFTMALPQAACTCTQSCCCGTTGDLPSCDSARIGRVTLQ